MTTPAASCALAQRRTWRAQHPVDLRIALAPLVRGPYDPTSRWAGATFWRATRTPLGPATTRLSVSSRHGEVTALAWGPGATWVLETLPDLLGAGDDPTGFDPTHPVLRDTWRRHLGWRVPRTLRVLEALVPAVLEQKVTSREAWRAFGSLVKMYGELAPGPSGSLPPGLHVPPDGRTWARIPSWEWHRAGADLNRSRAVVTAAGAAARLEQLAEVTLTEASRRLRTLPGIGVWTAAEVAQRALGDPDAVSVGDFHLSSLVGFALVGERVDDDAMLELLEPYRGHRYRAVRMIELSGLRPPRYGPRYVGRDYRAM